MVRVRHGQANFEAAAFARAVARFAGLQPQELAALLRAVAGVAWG